MTLLRALDRILVRIETVLVVAFLSVMIVLAFAQVVMRNLFDTGFLWGDPLVRQMVLWAGFIGAALATSEDRHISIDAITKFLSPRARHITKVVTGLAGAVVTYFLGAAAYRFLVDEHAAGSEILQGFPSWIGLLILPVGYGLIAVHFLILSIDAGVRAAKPGLPPEAKEA
jgi:TRAP-type C4-dicarboxylate transport system permease small subunit